MSPRTVAIRVRGETWVVPRGFGSAYRRIAAVHESEREAVCIEMVRTVLRLVGYEAPASLVAEWSLLRRVEAHVYAARVHLHASDNPVRVPARPAWLPPPWRGHGAGQTPAGVWVDFAKPTVLP